MRLAHCTVALAALAALAGTARAQGGPAAAQVDFTVFFQGSAVGVEQVTVVRTAEGVTILGSERIGPPLNIVTRRAEIRYTSDWRPLECILEGSARGQDVVLRTTVAGTRAISQVMQGQTPVNRVDEVAEHALLLPNLFFGAYEALAARLPGARVGDTWGAFSPPQTSATVTLRSAADDRVRTQAAVIEFRRYGLEISNPKNALDIELWVDGTGRMLRFTVPAQSFDIVRTDIASISSRREPVSRPNDEQVSIPALGFGLKGTFSRPAAGPGPAQRLPAVVLVGGSEATDREEWAAGIPLFGQIASALADAGFAVVRYDKRGVGQSGGRSETATLSDYADDAVAVVQFLKRRKDVDPSRIALVGYGEGGAVASVAASRSDSVAALVLAAAQGVTGAALALEQQLHLLERLNAPDDEKRAKIELQQRLHQALITGESLQSVPENLRRQADTPWFRSFLSYDPGKVVKNLDQPVLVLHGELDREIKPTNADRLAEIARARKGRAGQAVKLVKLAGINHLLVPAQTGETNEYDRLTDRTVSPQATAAVASWLKDVMKAR